MLQEVKSMFASACVPLATYMVVGMKLPSHPKMKDASQKPRGASEVSVETPL